MITMSPMNVDTKDARKFGKTFSAVFFVISMIALWKGSGSWGWFLAAAAGFLVVGVAAPRLLGPLYWAWMKFAFALGWFNTRLFLGIVFYLIISPVGLVMRILRKDALRLKFDRTASSYWITRESKPIDPKRYERLF